MASNMVRVRRLDGEVIEVEGAALPIYTQRGWVEVDGGAAKVADVLEQVGDDPAKAEMALVAEKSTDKPRKTLVTELERRTAADKEN